MGKIGSAGIGRKINKELCEGEHEQGSVCILQIFAESFSDREISQSKHTHTYSTYIYIYIILGLPLRILHVDVDASQLVIFLSLKGDSRPLDSRLSISEQMLV